MASNPLSLSAQALPRSIHRCLRALCVLLAFHGLVRASDFPCASEPFSLQPAWMLQADQADAQFGRQVSPAGDVNGDGLADVLVGAPLFENGEAVEGAVFLFLGTPSTRPLSPAWVLEGGAVRTGLQVATGAGDVNGDGFADVVVGNQYYPTESESMGRAMVFLGSPDGLASQPVWWIEGTDRREAVGVRVGPAGDANGDGLKDILVSRWGRVELFLGSPDGLEPAAAWAVEGELPSGYGRGPIGLPGRRFDDVIVPRYESLTLEVLALYRGYPQGLRRRAASELEVPTGNFTFGTALAPAGDTDGDGEPEMVVGMIGQLLVPPGSPCCPPEEVRVYEMGHRGLEGPGTLIHTTAYHGDLRWDGVRGAGDLNGDGFDDLAIAEYAVEANPGGPPPIRVMLYAGSAEGLPATPSLTLWGLQFNDKFGLSVAPAGDFDGDGCEDLIVGASLHDDGQHNEGAAFIFRGGAFPLP